LIDRLGSILEKFDGVVTVGEAQAAVIGQHILVPVKALHVPHLSASAATDSQSLFSLKQRDFAEGFLAFIEETRQWRPLMHLCDKVGKEIAYLGADEEMPVIALVSKQLSQLWPGD
jgi:hypothetical protein